MIIATDSRSDTVRTQYVKKRLTNFKLRTPVIDENYKPFVSCKFRISEAGNVVGSTFWTGGLYKEQNHMYVTEEKQDSEGQIHTSLKLIKIGSLYNTLECLLGFDC